MNPVQPAGASTRLRAVRGSLVEGGVTALGADRGRSLAVVVVNFGACALLERNLTRVADDLPVPGRVYVVDNWHSAAERAAVQRLATERAWVLLPQSSNLGFGAGVNVGAAKARADGATDLLLLNPDAVIDRASMTALLEATESGEVMAAPVIRTPEGRTWFAGLDLYLEDGSIAAPRRRSLRAGEPYVEWLSGACLCVPSELWDRTGGFDEEYFLYWEDVDFSRRVVAAGGRLPSWRCSGGRARRGGDPPREHPPPGREVDDVLLLQHSQPHALRRAASRPGGSPAVAVLGSEKRLPGAAARRPCDSSSAPSARCQAALKGLRDGRRIAESARSTGSGQ